MISVLALFLLGLAVPQTEGGCMFQEPFFFTAPPEINAVLDRRGRPIADK